MSPLPRTGVKAAGLILLFLAASAAWVRFDPDVPYVSRERAGSWIKHPEPYRLNRRAPVTAMSYFRKRFHVAAAVPAAFEFKAMREARIFFDGGVIWTTADARDWKHPVRINSPPLAPGGHTIEAQVLDEQGPALFWLSAPALSLATGADWEASEDGKSWRASAPADAPETAGLSFQFEPVARALRRSAPVLGAVFLLLFGWSWFNLKVLRPESVRWGLLAAWAVLAVNDFFKLPFYCGFDNAEHLKYVAYLIVHGRLPLANEGWQMFQAPLYYVLCLPIFLLPFKFASGESVARAMRVIPLLCGAAQIELAYRVARRSWPARADLQRLATVFAACLPMNIYISLAPGNEPLAGALISAVVAAALTLPERPGARTLAALGALLGLALLAKVSAVLVVPVLCWFLVDKLGARRGLKSAGVALGLAAAVCGWYYLRNWLELGSPFPGFGRAFVDWRQDPGYRGLGQFWFWGRGLLAPIYSGTLGLWNGFYSTLWLDGYLSGLTDFDVRPPWNYNFVLAGAWLALLPTGAILIGAFEAALGEKKTPEAVRFSVVGLAVYFAAFVAVFLKNPVYSTTKATYTLGLAPCYALLACAGCDRLCRGRISRALVYAGMGCWGVASYLAYFVR